MQFRLRTLMFAVAVLSVVTAALAGGLGETVQVVVFSWLFLAAVIVGIILCYLGFALLMYSPWFLSFWIAGRLMRMTRSLRLSMARRRATERNTV